MVFLLEEHDSSYIDGFAYYHLIKWSNELFKIN